MTAQQLVQTLGFFWLASTGLLLSAELRVWSYQDFAAPFFGVLLYLVGRNWTRWRAPILPWRLITGIGGLSLLHAALFAWTLGDRISTVSMSSLLVGGLLSLGLGLKIRSAN